MKRQILAVLFLSTCFSLTEASETTEWVLNKGQNDCEKICGSKQMRAVYGGGGRAVCASLSGEKPDIPGFTQKNWEYCMIPYGENANPVGPYACLCSKLETN